MPRVLLSCLLAGLASALDSAAIKAANVLRCGTTWDRENVGKKVGSDVEGIDGDVCKLIAKKLGVPVAWVEATTVNRFSLLNDGKIDVLVRSTTDTIGRRNVYNLTFSQPYFMDGQGFAVKKTGGPTTVAGITSYCVAGSSSSYENAAATYPTKSAVTYKSAEEAIAGLHAGACDAVTTDKTILAGLIKVNSAYSMALLPDTFSLEPIAVATRMQDSQLLNDVQVVLLDQFKGGSSAPWNNLYNKWLGALVPISGINDIANVSNQGLMYFSNTYNWNDNILRNEDGFSKLDLAAIKAKGSLICYEPGGKINLHSTALCEALGFAVFGTTGKSTNSNSQPFDVVLGAPMSQIGESPTHILSPLYLYDASNDQSGNLTVMTAATTKEQISLTRIINFVRNAIVLAAQLKIKDQASYDAASKTIQGTTLMGSTAANTNNMGMGTDISSTFFKDFFASSAYKTLADITPAITTTLNKAYTTSPGRLWSIPWNGENVPKIERSAGDWELINTDGTTGNCVEYYLPEAETATNRLYYFADSGAPCWDTYDLVNKRGISTCNISTSIGVFALEYHTWIMRTLPNGNEQYATIKDPADPSNFNYPTAFVATPTVGLDEFRKCTPGPVLPPFNGALAIQAERPLLLVLATLVCVLAAMGTVCP